MFKNILFKKLGEKPHEARQKHPVDRSKKQKKSPPPPQRRYTPAENCLPLNFHSKSMAPEEIIRQYYKEGSAQYALLLEHSTAVAEKALTILRRHPEWGVDATFIREAALLHDIGIYRTYAPGIECFGSYPYICHGYLGAALLRSKSMERHARVCERHTGSGITREYIVNKRLPLPARDMLPETWEEKLICFADKFYSKSHPDQAKTIEEIRLSMSAFGDDAVARWDELVKLFYA
jgi:uncharacterized protein